MLEEQYQIKGMHCASCGTIISKKLGKLNGINSCSVNYATEELIVDYDPNKITPSKMDSEISKYGYNLLGIKSNETNKDDFDITEKIKARDDQKKHDIEILQEKVGFSFPITIMFFVLMMWEIAGNFFVFVPKLPLPMQLFNTISFLIASIILFWIGKTYISAVVRFVNHRVANMDTLVGIGTLTAYLYSSLIFLVPEIAKILSLPEYTYFDVTIVVIGLITLGKYLELRSKHKTSSAIEKLIKLQAKTAVVIRNNHEIEIPISEVLVGDIVVVKPGSKIPVDGVVVDGFSSVDESMINGEPIPIDKKIGSFVIGATINKQGTFNYKATKVGSNTMLSEIIRMIQKSQGSKMQIQNLADKVSSIFIPTVLVISVITLLVWLTLGTYFLGFSSSISYAILSFVGILVIACPCALGLATPTAIVVGIGKAAENGILVKNAESLETLHKVNKIVFDKTGTITNGTPKVTDIISVDKSFNENKILEYSYSLENNSNHPLASAIVAKAKDNNIKMLKASNFREVDGIGVSGLVQKKIVYIRKPKEKDHSIKEIKKLELSGKTVVVVEVDIKVVGLIAISDTIKSNTKDVVSQIHKQGIETILLTGDNSRSANFIANQVGIKNVISQVLPQDKNEVISKLQKNGDTVAMVGDGINDAPALTQSNIGIAMATGSDIAIESADITLTGGDIDKVLKAIKLSKATISTVKQNLFWAFIYNIIGIPLAAGLFYPIWGIFLNPIFAGLAMATSSISVVLNSLRLNRIKV